MRLTVTIASLLMSFSGLASPAQAQDNSIRDINFNNFSYTIRSGGMGPSGSVTLTQGEYREGRASVRLRNVRYADLNGDDTEDVVVILASTGGGSGVSTHAFGFTYDNGAPREILYRMNFVDIQPGRNGFTLVKSSPRSTGTQECSGFFVRSNALDIETYQWNGLSFVLTDATTAYRNEVCNYF